MRVEGRLDEAIEYGWLLRHFRTAPSFYSSSLVLDKGNRLPMISYREPAERESPFEKASYVINEWYPSNGDDPTVRRNQGQSPM